jgi:hypothetical protein
VTTDEFRISGCASGLASSQLGSPLVRFAVRMTEVRLGASERMGARFLLDPSQALGEARPPAAFNRIWSHRGHTH